jgi:hypothetical protein
MSRCKRPRPCRYDTALTSYVPAGRRAEREFVGRQWQAGPLPSGSTTPTHNACTQPTVEASAAPPLTALCGRCIAPPPPLLYPARAPARHPSYTRRRLPRHRRTRTCVNTPAATSSLYDSIWPSRASTSPPSSASMTITTAPPRATSTISRQRITPGCATWPGSWSEGVCWLASVAYPAAAHACGLKQRVPLAMDRAVKRLMPRARSRPHHAQELGL